MNNFGLIGKKLSHSFSKEYFTKKFKELSIDSSYELIELESISEIEDFIKQNKFKGLNVTIPYKESIIPYLDELDVISTSIGAVNTIKFENGKSKGYNTDYFGFKQSLLSFISSMNVKAIILGAGGASRAVQKVLLDLKIDFEVVSRKANENCISYDELNEEIIETHKLIINTTPLGMFPNILLYPDIAYNCITNEHYCFDLIYNPDETTFILNAKSKGAKVKNGLEMLHGQAEKSWDIWNR